MSRHIDDDLNSSALDLSNAEAEIERLKAALNKIIQTKAVGDDGHTMRRIAMDAIYKQTR